MISFHTPKDSPPQARAGAIGVWDRVVGPGASLGENMGTLGITIAGAVLAPTLSAGGGGNPALRSMKSGEGVLLRLLAADLWGGAWCNNTPAAMRWYQRPKQGLTHHLAFTAGHIHPFAIAFLDAKNKDSNKWFHWGLKHYLYVLLATAVIRSVPAQDRRKTAVIATLGGLVLDSALNRPSVAPWFGALYYVKLLAGHAGAVGLSRRR